jgi:uncharacterized membrane protein
MSGTEAGLARRAPNRLTARLLTAGSSLSFAAFAIGFLADLADGTAPHARTTLAIDSLARLDPEAWALVGVLVLFATPIAGLLATVAEYRRSETRMSLIALGILGLLAVSVAIALVR